MPNDNAPAGPITIGRVYDPPTDDGRARVLVDRLWPRGLSRESARLDEWAKAVAPSTDLRTWYHHEPGRFPEFRDRYRQELAEPEHGAAVDHLCELGRRRGLVLLTAARDPALSHAAVLSELLLDRIATDPERCLDQGGELRP